MTTHSTLKAGLVVAVWLAAAGLGAPQGTPRPQVVAVPDFRLTVPPGKWAVEEDGPNAHVTLIATSVSKLGPRSETRLDVRVVRPDPERRLAPAAAAGAALATELAAVRRRAAAGWRVVVTPRDTLVGCRALVGSRYRLEPVGRRTLAEEDGTILAWAPPEYPQTGRVVLFRLTLVARDATGLYLKDEATFFKLVESLELQSTAAPIIC